MTGNFSKRYVIVGMVFVGYTIFFVTHANVGMAVVAMTSSKNITGPDGVIEVIPAEFDWNSIQKAMVIGSFSYGRLMGALLAIYVGQIGGSTAYFLGLVSTAIVLISVPFLLNVNFWLFVIGNALSGTFEGISYTSVPQIWSRWAPPDERAKMASISVTGVYVGQIVSFFVGGWILYEWNWEILFYVTGITTLVWGCIWFMVVKNDPADDKWISKAERDYIKEQLATKIEDKKLEYPYKDIMTCLPFWITCLGKFSCGFGVTFMMSYLPQYIQDTNNVNIKEIGYLSMIPQICAVIANPPAGYIFDYLRSNKILSLTNIHKLYTSVGLFAGTIAFLAASLWSNFVFSIVCMAISQLLITCAVLQNQIVVLDLAPRYASFMASVAMFFYNLACILTPTIIGFIVTSHGRFQWSICFIIFAAQFTTTALIYIKFLSVKLQRWANYKIDEQPGQSLEIKSST
ncbi:sodium-dependent phosphate transport protein 4-like [Planococcus citri]|uniref:sodium-dependent phosphate transport protein 4-like n=1 Tax=Planococcus citri TaxID=170843 RepID=UPI0031F8DD1F